MATGDQSVLQQDCSPSAGRAAESLLDGAQYVTLVVDEQGRICGCGVAAEELFATSQSQLIGATISEFVVGFLFEGNSPYEYARQLLRHCAADYWQKFDAIDMRGHTFSLEVRAKRRATDRQEVFVLNLRRPE